MKAVKSSNIESIGHEGNVLTVKFKNGGVYDYHGVTPEQHDALVNAESVGSHFHHNIKGQFEGKKGTQMSDYTYWQDALAGKKPPMFVDQPELGFYRRGVKQRDEKGNNKRVGWQAVAVFMDGDKIIGRVGPNDLTGDALNELWSYIAGNPISEEAYRAVERGEPWPDAPELPVVREITAADNNPPEVLTDKDHAAGIDAAIGAALKAVTTEAEAGQALGSKNRIAELRLAADKAGKALYDPPYREYKRLHGLWSPMVARADTAEKGIAKAILTFREKERQRIAAEQVEADKKQREIDEANQRAADRAIIAGLPEELPEIIEAEQPVAVAPILPTYGTRQLKEEVKFFLDKVTSWDMLFAHFKANADVQALLMKLASVEIKARRPVPGTLTREGLI